MASASSLSFGDTLPGRALRLVGRVVLLMLVAWLALLGFALGLVLLLGSLLRGRSLARRFRSGPFAAHPAHGRAGAAPPRSAGAEVIEGQAREVPPPR